MLDLALCAPRESSCVPPAAVQTWTAERQPSRRERSDEPAPPATDIGLAARAPVSASPESDARSWMTRIQARDESALRRLHDAFGRRIFVCALGMVRREEVAHEVVSITFMQAWTAAADYDPLRGTVAAWLTLIARSRSLDALRRARVHGSREVHLDDDESNETPTLDAMHDPFAHLARKTRDHRLHRAMLRLSPMQRQVLSLTTLDGLSQDEASQHLNMPLGTVKSHARRGLTALRARCAVIGLTAD